MLPVIENKELFLEQAKTISSSDLAAMYGTTSFIMKKICNELGIIPLSKGKAREIRIKEKLKTLSIKDVALSECVSVQTVKCICYKNKIPFKHISQQTELYQKKRNVKNRTSTEAILCLINNGFSYSDIGRWFNLSRQRIHQIANENALYKSEV